MKASRHQFDRGSKVIRSLLRHEGTDEPKPLNGDAVETPDFIADHQGKELFRRELPPTPLFISLGRHCSACVPVVELPVRKPSQFFGVLRGEWSPAFHVTSRLAQNERYCSF